MRIFLTQAEAERLAGATPPRASAIAFDNLAAAIREASSKIGTFENEGRVRAVSVTFWIDEGLPHAGAEVPCYTCDPERGGQCRRWAEPPKVPPGLACAARARARVAFRPTMLRSQP